MTWSTAEKETKSAIRRWGWWIVGTIILLTIIGKACSVADKVFDVDKGIASYEQFYQMYEQGEQLCADISVMQGADSLSGGFSKTERIMGLENRFNDLIRDYNAKSHAWTIGMWKSEDLPYTLSRHDYNCKQH